MCASTLKLPTVNLHFLGSHFTARKSWQYLNSKIEIMFPSEYLCSNFTFIKAVMMGMLIIGNSPLACMMIFNRSKWATLASRTLL